MKKRPNGEDKGLTPTQLARIARDNNMFALQGRGIELYIREKGNTGFICKELGISRQTWYRWMRNEKYKLAIEQADKLLDDKIEQVLISKAERGSSSELLFYLKKRHEKYKDIPTTIGVRGEGKVEVIIRDYKSSTE